MDDYDFPNLHELWDSSSILKYNLKNLDITQKIYSCSYTTYVS